jgi:hypothetical protein
VCGAGPMIGELEEGAGGGGIMLNRTCVCLFAAGLTKSAMG